MKLIDTHLIHYAEMYANKLNPYSTQDMIKWMRFTNLVNWWPRI